MDNDELWMDGERLTVGDRWVWVQHDNPGQNGVYTVNDDMVPITDFDTTIFPNRKARRMGAKRNQARSDQSLAWNARRRENLENLASGMDPPDSSCVRDDEGWFLVSRHAMGVASAYAVQRVLRKVWGGRLEFRVNNSRDDATEWDGEIWAKPLESGEM